jgi:cytoskeletal protein CcmA (bactofilin family)
MERTSEIGASIVVRGEILSNEDLIIAGRVEGSVEMAGHRLTINQGAALKAKVHAREVAVSGGLVGTIQAVERVDLQPTADVQGDVATPSLKMADGAHLKGQVEMPKTKASKLQLAS